MKRFATQIAYLALLLAFIYYCEQAREWIRHKGAQKRVVTLLADIPAAPLKVVMQSIDGTTRVCPAEAMQWDAGPVLTITGLACAPDSIFKNGFEP
jgi:hypothetical protein